MYLFPSFRAAAVFTFSDRPPVPTAVGLDYRNSRKYKRATRGLKALRCENALAVLGGTLLSRCSTNKSNRQKNRASSHRLPFTTPSPSPN